MLVPPSTGSRLMSASETALTSAADDRNRRVHAAFDLDTEQDLSIISSLNESHVVDDVRSDVRGARHPDIAALTSQLPPALFSAMLAPGFFGAAQTRQAPTNESSPQQAPVAHTHDPSLTSSFSLKPVSYEEDFADSVSNVGDAREQTEVSISFVNKPSTTSSRVNNHGDFVAPVPSLQSAAAPHVNLAESARTLFESLSAQNYEGVEFIRAQIEGQRVQMPRRPEEVALQRPNTSQDSTSLPASSIQLHPPVQLDTSNLSGAGESEGRSSSSGSAMRSAQQEQRVTWQQSLLEEHTTHSGEVHSEL